jgi:lysine N6-hydroxylase
MTNSTYDIIGIGIGPFNLGLAALCEPVEQIKALFLDQKSQFHWHPGLLLENTSLQVPFLADLVTMADPCSKFSFLNYLKAQSRLYNFYFLEKLSYFAPRIQPLLSMGGRTITQLSVWGKSRSHFLGRK